MSRPPLVRKSRRAALATAVCLAGFTACDSAADAPKAVASAVPAPAVTALPEPAPDAAALPDFTDPSWTRVPSRAGKYLVCWRSTSGKVPRNEDFELEVWVLRDGAPVKDALVTVQGWMPEHGHGMLRQAKTEVREDGSYHVVGMLLHMRGHWQIFFEVLEGSLAETAECAVDL